MPIQTTQTGNIYFPDGAQVLFTPSGGSPLDLGAVNSDITATLNYTENQVETANAGKLDKQIRDMTMDAGFTLINLNPSNIATLGGGIFETVETAGSSVTSIDDQTIASGAALNKKAYPLSIVETGGDALKVSSALVIAGVSGSTDNSLTEDDDYYIIVDDNSFSGYSIVFDTAGTTLTTMEQVFTIEYTSVTPVARTAVYAGTSTQVLTAGTMSFVHTDGNGLERRLDLYSVDPNTGGFQFNFKTAASDGVEEMPLTFTAKLDTSRTNGRQLMAWIIDAGAQ
jgi:hypothetical protein